MGIEKSYLYIFSPLIPFSFLPCTLVHRPKTLCFFDRIPIPYEQLFHLWTQLKLNLFSVRSFPINENNSIKYYMEYPSVSFIRIHSICWQANHRLKPANIAIWRFHTESACNALLEKRGLCCRDQWHKRGDGNGDHSSGFRDHKPWFQDHWWRGGTLICLSWLLKHFTLSSGLHI